MTYYQGAYYAVPGAEEFRAALAALPQGRVRRILAARGINPDLAGSRDAEARASYAAAQLAMTENVARTLLLLSRRELSTLQAIWRHGPALSRAEIAALFAGALEGDLLTEALDRLESLALLLPGSGERLVVPGAVRGVLLGNRAQPRPASALFSALASNVLSLIAATLTLAPAKRKESRVAALQAAFDDQAALRARIAALPEIERAILDDVVAHGGAVNPYDVSRRIREALPGSTSQYSQDFYLHEYTRNRVAPLLRLQLLGLLVPYPAGYPSALVTPDEVLTALLPPPQAPEPAQFVEPPLAPPPPDARPAGGAPAPVLDLLDTLRFAAETGLALTKKGVLPKPQRARLQKYLLAPDPIYADLLFALALRTELLQLASNLDWVVRVNEQLLGGLLGLAEPAWRLMLLAIWLDLPDWRDGDPEPYQRDDAWQATPPAQRRAALRLLDGLPDEGAGLDSLSALLRFRYPRAFREDGPATMQSILPSALELLRGVVQTLSWLGLAEPLTPAERAGVPAEVSGVRLGELGREVVRIAVEAGDAMTVERAANIDETLQQIETLPRTDRVVVQPTLDVLAPPNIEPRVYYDLRRFAALTRSGGVRTLTISAASMRRAFDAGIEPQSVRSYLEEHGGAPVPQTIAALLDEAAARHGRIHIGGAHMYVTVDDPHLLVELQADRRLKGLTFRTLAPTVAVVEGGTPADLLSQLREAGHMPVSDDEKRKPRDPLRGDAPQAEGSPVPRSRDGRIVAFPGVAVDDDNEEGLPVGKKVANAGAIDAALRQAVKRGEQVEIGYRRGGDPTVAPLTHQLSVIELTPGEVYGRCWLCGTSIRFKTGRIAWARPTGDTDPW